MSSSETAVTAQEDIVERKPDIFYDIECEGEQIASREEPQVQESRSRKNEKKKSCCGCDSIVETSDSDSISLVSWGGFGESGVDN